MTPPPRSPIALEPHRIPTTERLIKNRAQLNQYNIISVIGAGYHGKVYYAKKVKDQYPVGVRRVAIKALRRDTPQDRTRLLRRNALPKSGHTPVGDKLGAAEPEIRREIAIMKKLTHAHVVRLYEVIDDRMQDKIYMVMEYLAGGEVTWTSNEQPILTVDQTRRIIRDAILGLEYLHYQGIIHRDIKPANLLYSRDRSVVKIADFGISQFSKPLRIESAGKVAANDIVDPILLESKGLSRAGTPSFLPPELVSEHAGPRPPITKAVDIWALGVTLYCLLFGILPWRPDPDIPVQAKQYNVWKKIADDDWEALPTMGADLMPTGGRHPSADSTETGANIIRLLDHFLQKDPAKRVTLEQAKQNDWVLHRIAGPDKWLEVTSQGKIDVDDHETTAAVSTVRFRWTWGARLGLGRRLSQLLGRRKSPAREATGATSRSAVLGHRPSGSLHSKATSPLRRHPKRLPSLSSRNLRSKSSDRYPTPPTARPHTPNSLNGVPGSGVLKSYYRRGSDIFTPESRKSSGSRPPSPAPSDRRRSRLDFLTNMLRPVTPVSSSPDTSSPTTTRSATWGRSSIRSKRQALREMPSGSIASTSRRSEDVPGRRRRGKTSGLDAAHRASSWGYDDDPDIATPSFFDAGQDFEEVVQHQHRAGIDDDDDDDDSWSSSDSDNMSPGDISDDEFENHATRTPLVLPSDGEDDEDPPENVRFEYESTAEDDDEGLMISPKKRRPTQA
ncbi:kinase-like domain-containing protein [Schizophyllum amplum]|uniref:Kinase-like domain-containing protein n=1 Tax=Schizophyllum amplum TaxID=97359 RepID=A0A550CIG2_9AGAR|nr:kinase-like domain-containing protein [Auriculariopsis ampla]